MFDRIACVQGRIRTRREDVSKTLSQVKPDILSSPTNNWGLEKKCESDQVKYWFNLQSKGYTRPTKKHFYIPYSAFLDILLS